MMQICWLREQLLASQEGLCSVGLGSWGLFKEAVSSSGYVVLNGGMISE
jgi:hypothetical protein